MRIRTIKPEFWKNEKLAAQPHVIRLLFIGLWNYADREGRMEDRPARIKAEIFPYDQDLDIDTLLTELANSGFIVRYEVDGNRYIAIPTFRKHQRPHPREAASTVPVPTKVCARHNLGDPVSIVHSPLSIVHNPDNPDNHSPEEPEPEPEPEEELERRSTSWPKDFTLTAPMTEYATKRGVDAEAEFEAWRDYALAKGLKYKIWERAWYTWVRNAVAFGRAKKPLVLDQAWRQKMPPLQRAPNDGMVPIAGVVRKLTEKLAEKASD